MTNIDSIPDPVLAVYSDYRETKENWVRENGGPAGIGMRFAFDFGSNFRTWPFFREEFLELASAPDEPYSDDNPLMAIVDVDPDELRDRLLTGIARLMTMFGPPRIACACSDTYFTEIPIPPRVDGEIEPVIVDPLADDFADNPDTKVRECLIVTATRFDGDSWAIVQPYKYGDQGLIEFEEPQNDVVMLSPSGQVTSLLHLITTLHDKQPHDVLLTIAGGDEDVVNDMLRHIADS